MSVQCLNDWAFQLRQIKFDRKTDFRPQVCEVAVAPRGSSCGIARPLQGLRATLYNDILAGSEPWRVSRNRTPVPRGKTCTAG